MKCCGCYKEVKDGYCLSCRKKLFDKAKIPSVLTFDAPKTGNIAGFQEHSKHLSISGVQLKYSLRIENKELVLTEKNGQYILKPIPPATQLEEVNDIPENEHLTLQIADQLLRISTAANALIYFKDGQSAYITRRFDVQTGGSKYMQEDFAQLSARSKASHGEYFKYQGSYEEIGLLIKKYVAAAPPAIERFFQIVLFNYIFSNGDAHLKNFSLIRDTDGEYQLTPAYDILSTIIHTNLESDTALDLYAGDIDSPFYSNHGFYGRPNFMDLAKRLSIVEKRAVRIIDNFILHKEAILQMINNSFLSNSAKQKYLANLEDRLSRMQIAN